MPDLRAFRLLPAPMAHLFVTAALALATGCFPSCLVTKRQVVAIGWTPEQEVVSLVLPKRYIAYKLLLPTNGPSPLDVRGDPELLPLEVHTAQDWTRTPPSPCVDGFRWAAFDPISRTFLVDDTCRLRRIALDGTVQSLRLTPGLPPGRPLIAWTTAHAYWGADKNGALTDVDLRTGARTGTLPWACTEVLEARRKPTEEGVSVEGAVSPDGSTVVLATWTHRPWTHVPGEFKVVLRTREADAVIHRGPCPPYDKGPRSERWRGDRSERPEIAWSPDGRSIYLVHPEYQGVLLTRGASPTADWTRRDLVGLLSPTWSPDSRHLAGLGWYGGVEALKVLSVE